MNGKVIAVVGAGGKTTLIRRLAGRSLSEGKKVFVTTTAHMIAEPDTLIDPSAEDIAGKLRSERYCMAGTDVPGTGKIGPLEDPVYRAGCEAADLGLVEADGARNHLLKYPAAYEPVIPVNTDGIIIVMGRDAAGGKVSETIHRYELACEHLKVGPEDTVTEELILLLAEEGYAIPLRAAHPDAEITVVLARQGADGREYEVYENY